MTSALAGLALSVATPSLLTVASPEAADASTEAGGFLGCRSELIVGRDDGDGPRWVVDRLDPASGWYSEIPDGGSGWGPNRRVTALTVGDLDGNGDPELVVGRNGAGDGGVRFEIIDHDGMGWGTVLGTGGTGWGPNRDVTALVAADVNGDGEDELVVGRNAGEGARYEIVSHDGGVWDTIVTDGGSGWGPSFGVRALAAGDIDGDGDEEIAIGRTGSANARYIVIDFTGDAFEPILEDGGSDWGGDRELTDLAMGDVDGDGDDELILGRNAGPGVRVEVQDWRDDEFVVGAGKGLGTENHGVTALAVGDVNADGEAEIAVGYSTPYSAGIDLVGLNQDHHTGEWENLWGRRIDSYKDGDRIVTALAVGDVNGDGINEIAAGRAQGENMRYAVYSGEEDGAPLLIDGGDGWGPNRGTTAIALPNVSGDRDGDFIPDCWEVQGGVDLDEDGVFEVELPYGDPDRPNLYLEIDCLVGEAEGEVVDPMPTPGPNHCPPKRALQSAINVFLRAKGVAPDGSDGFHVVVDIGDIYGDGWSQQWSEYDGAIGYLADLGGGEQIPLEGREVIDATSTDDKEAPVSMQDILDGYFEPARTGIYRYALWAHQTNFRRSENDCTGGFAEGGTDHFMVTLGGENRFGDQCWDEDAHGHSYGSHGDHAGVFVHELGHKIGLGHGGHEDVNYKPNYLSNMNYLYNRCNVPRSPIVPGVPGGCHLSDMVMPTLDEMNLDECAGIDGGQFGFGNFDWNGDGAFQGETCPPWHGQENLTEGIDINEDRFCVEPGEDGYLSTTAAEGDELEDGKIVDGADRKCQTVAHEDDDQVRERGHVQERYLTGSNDWTSLDLKFRKDHDHLSVGPDPEELAEIYDGMRENIGPDIEIEANGIAPVIGDVAEVDVTVRNVGGGPAEDVTFGGKSLSWSLGTGNVAADTETTTTIAVNIPWWDCDGRTSVIVVSMAVDLFGETVHFYDELEFDHNNDWCVIG